MKNATAEQRKRLALPRYWSMCNQFFPLICMIWLWLLFGKHTITLFYVENWSDLMHVSFVMHCIHWFGIYGLFSSSSARAGAYDSAPTQYTVCIFWTLRENEGMPMEEDCLRARDTPILWMSTLFGSRDDRVNSIASIQTLFLSSDLCTVKSVIQHEKQKRNG